ncbi:hypothetical protein H4219_006405, partial [Mycoemilia scoparia]
MTGKTMFLSMVEYFFEMENCEIALEAKKALFKELLLGDVDGGQKFIENHCGQYPVIKITFQ